MAAALKVFRDGAWHELTGLKVYRSGAWRQLKTLKVYSGGAWRLIGNFVGPLSVVASPSSVSGTSYNGGHPEIVESDITTATPSGGIAPYSYSWARISGDAMTAGAPSNATTPFYATLVYGASATATWRVTVTDAIGSTATADVTATLSNNL